MRVVPLCAVTTIGMDVVPTASEMAPEAEPDATVVPLTVTLATGLCRVGVTVMEDLDPVTVSEYAPATPAVGVPPLVFRLERLVLVEGCTVSETVRFDWARTELLTVYFAVTSTLNVVAALLTRSVPVGVPVMAQVALMLSPVGSPVAEQALIAVAVPETPELKLVVTV